jgi:hypothetical protein
MSTFKDKTLLQSRMFTTLMESMVALVPGRVDLVLSYQGLQEVHLPEKLQEEDLSTTLLVLDQPRGLPVVQVVQVLQDQALLEAQALVL